jgi:hypothetical protein
VTRQFCSHNSRLCFSQNTPGETLPPVIPVVGGGCRYTLLHLAAGLGHTACLERLLVAGRRPDTNTADNEDGYSALHAAAAAGQGPCISMLLDRGRRCLRPS